METVFYVRSNIMMNRSSTEEKVNKNLSKDMLDMTNSLPNSLKCALQFREVCEKELIRIEIVKRENPRQRLSILSNLLPILFS
jgi:hypothetical protein